MISWWLWCASATSFLAFLDGLNHDDNNLEKWCPPAGRWHSDGIVMGFWWPRCGPCRQLQASLTTAWDLLHWHGSQITMGNGRIMVQGGDTQCRTAPAAYPVHIGRLLMRGLACAAWLFCKNGISRPRQWCPSPALENVACRQNDRPLRQHYASHEGPWICSHPTLLPHLTCCLQSVHELPTTHSVNPISYKSTSPWAQWSRQGACNNIWTWLPRFAHTPAAPHHQHVLHSINILGRAAAKLYFGRKFGWFSLGLGHKRPPIAQFLHPWHNTTPSHPTTLYLLIPTPTSRTLLHTLTPSKRHASKFCKIVFPKYSSQSHQHWARLVGVRSLNP